VIITCPECKTQYRYDEARFGGASSKRLKCTRCSAVFEVTNPSVEELDATGIADHERVLPLDAASQTDKMRLEPEPPELPQLAPLERDLRYSLAVIAGSQAGSVFTISSPRIYIGRGSSADVQLKDAEISRRHAMIEIRGEEATVSDLGSTNGIFVKGQRVTSHTLANQNEFTLGSTTLMLIVTPRGESIV